MMKVAFLLAALGLVSGGVLPPVFVVKPGDLPVLTKPQACFDGVDMIFALDTSDSFGQDRYDLAINRIQEFAKNLDIGTGPGQSRIGVVDFDNGDEQLVAFEMDAYTSSDEIVAGLGKHSAFLDGKDCDFAKGLDFCRTKMFTKARANPVRKVLAFVGDGWTNHQLGPIVMARDQALKAGIDIFFFYFGTDHGDDTIEAIVGDDHFDERAFDFVKFTDLTQLAPCGTVGPEGDHVCHHGGIPSCECPLGYAPPVCDPINVCPEAVHHTHDVCNGHGNCTYNITDGSWCTCEYPYKGRWCEIAPPGSIPSQPCLAYESEWTLNNGSSAIVHYTCNLKLERCIPNNIDCALNTHTHMVCKDAKDTSTCHYECDPKPGDPKGYPHCKCDYPVGWCVPLEAGNKAIALVEASLQT